MKDFKANENETILENEFQDIFPNQVSIKKKPLIETMEDNRSLQTQSRTINSDEERMKLNLQNCLCIKKIWNFEIEIICL